MSNDDVVEIAALLRARNRIDDRIATIINRPMATGHLGEWLAAQIFDIELEHSAAEAAIDGRFRSGPLRSRTVNVKWYLKRDGLLNTTDNPALNYCLVLTGPPEAAQSSLGKTRPWCIENVYLFDANSLRAEQSARGIKSGVVASVRKARWMAAEIFPKSTNPRLRLSADQAWLLRLFAWRDDTDKVPHLNGEAYRHPDPRWKGVVVDQAELADRVNHWTVGDAVPEKVADVLRVARTLLIDSYTTYDYSLVATTWGLLVTEASLRGCLPIAGARQDKRTFVQLVATARRRGLITKEEANALGGLAGLRNLIVHGHLQPKAPDHSYSANDALEMLEAIHDAITDIYMRALTAQAKSDFHPRVR
jgi:hypothetical protein